MGATAHAEKRRRRWPRTAKRKRVDVRPFAIYVGDSSAQSVLTHGVIMSGGMAFLITEPMIRLHRILGPLIALLAWTPLSQAQVRCSLAFDPPIKGLKAGDTCTV